MNLLTLMPVSKWSHVTRGTTRFQPKPPQRSSVQERTCNKLGRATAGWAGDAATRLEPGQTPTLLLSPARAHPGHSSSHPRYRAERGPARRSQPSCLFSQARTNTHCPLGRPSQTVGARGPWNPGSSQRAPTQRAAAATPAPHRGSLDPGGRAEGPSMAAADRVT